MKLKIFHSINAGLYMWNGESGLLIDAFHNGQAEGFSVSPKMLISSMNKKKGIFAYPCDLIYTHLHPDHYDFTLTEVFKRNNPDAIIYEPGLEKNSDINIRRVDSAEKIVTGKYTVWALNSLHDGDGFENVKHRVFIIETNRKVIIVMGDAIPEYRLIRAIKNVIKDRHVDAVFINPFQISNEERIDIIKSIDAKRNYIYHLPLSEDDKYKVRILAESFLNKAKKSGLKRIKIISHMNLVDEF